MHLNISFGDNNTSSGGDDVGDTSGGSGGEGLGLGGEGLCDWAIAFLVRTLKRIDITVNALQWLVRESRAKSSEEQTVWYKIPNGNGFNLLSIDASAINKYVTKCMEILPTSRV